VAGLVLGGAALFKLGGRAADSRPAPPEATSIATAAPTLAAAPVVSSPPPASAEPVPPALSASVAPAPSATASAAALDTSAARTVLRHAAAGHDWFHDPAMITAARDVAASAGVAGGEAADRVFAALAQRLGSDGLDVLYDIVRTRGGSRAATRAQELLRQGPVIARATPELRITVALRDAPCADQTALLERAAAEGDARTLVVMETVSSSCLGKSNALEVAVKALKARLRPH